MAVNRRPNGKIFLKRVNYFQAGAAQAQYSFGRESNLNFKHCISIILSTGK